MIKVIISQLGSRTRKKTTKTKCLKGENSLIVRYTFKNYLFKLKYQLFLGGIKKRNTVIGCKKVESFLFVVMCVIITPYSLLTGSLAIELLRSL